MNFLPAEKKWIHQAYVTVNRSSSTRKASATRISRCSNHQLGSTSYFIGHRAENRTFRQLCVPSKRFLFSLGSKTSKLLPDFGTALLEVGTVVHQINVPNPAQLRCNRYARTYTHTLFEKNFRFSSLFLNLIPVFAIKYTVF